jgi:hypothetical protein
VTRRCIGIILKEDGNAEETEKGADMFLNQSHKEAFEF